MNDEKRKPADVPGQAEGGPKPLLEPEWVARVLLLSRGFADGSDPKHEALKKIERGRARLRALGTVDDEGDE